IEPPVFMGEEQLGARLVDNLLVTQDGAELLSRFSRDLIVVPLCAAQRGRTGLGKCWRP
ncbi:MAG: hypothetical protein H7274_03625, partial [Rhodoferax sp.]|nr:hypothetical protein [Rhodoferax sp.]